MLSRPFTASLVCATLSLAACAGDGAFFSGPAAKATPVENTNTPRKIMPLTVISLNGLSLEP